MEGSAAGVGEGEANTGGLVGGREVCWGWRGLLQEWEREKPIQVG